MAPGDLRSSDSMLVVGFRVLRDFHAAYLADNVTRAGAPAKAIVLDRRGEGRPEGHHMGLARAVDHAAGGAEIAAEGARGLDGAERVGFPAGLGAEDPHGVWNDLQQRLGMPVFEIPTLPPSVPGMRVFRTLRDRLRRNGGRIILNATALSGARAGAGFASVRATAAGRDVDYRARWIVLA